MSAEKLKKNTDLLKKRYAILMQKVLLKQKSSPLLVCSLRKEPVHKRPLPGVWEGSFMDLNLFVIDQVARSKK